MSGLYRAVRSRLVYPETRHAGARGRGRSPRLGHPTAISRVLPPPEYGIYGEGADNAPLSNSSGEGSGTRLMTRRFAVGRTQAAPKGPSPVSFKGGFRGLPAVFLPARRAWT